MSAYTKGSQKPRDAFAGVTCDHISINPFLRVNMNAFGNVANFLPIKTKQLICKGHTAINAQEREIIHVSIITQVTIEILLI